MQHLIFIFSIKTFFFFFGFFSFLTFFFIFSGFFQFMKIVDCGFQCPRDNNGNWKDGVFRDTHVCGTYYHCINGRAHIQTCPPGRHFKVSAEDCKLISCVEPKYSSCKDVFNPYQKKIDYETKSAMTSKAARRIDECQNKMNETVHHAFDCRIYYHCFNGVAWPQRCPNGYFFSPQIDFNQCSTKFCQSRNYASCPGQWGEWADWSQCKGSCGTRGRRERRRRCRYFSDLDIDAYCPGSSYQSDYHCMVDNCEKPPAFSVSLISTSAQQGTINWTKIDINDENTFNVTTNRANIIKDGVYLLTMTATVKSGQRVYLRNREYSSNSDTFVIKREANNVIEDTLSREGLFHLDTHAGDQDFIEIYQDSYYQGKSEFVGSIDGKETSLASTFYRSYSNYFYASTSDYYDKDKLIKFYRRYDNGFRDDGSRFTCDNRGYFYVSYGIGLEYNGKAEIQFHYLTENSVNMNVKNGLNTTDTFVKNFIINYTMEFPMFELYIKDGRVYSQYSEWNTYMMALRLDEDKPMFSIYKNYREVNGIQTKIKFYEKNIVVDNFNGWNSTLNYYVIPKKGNYYISTNIPICHSTFGRTQIFIKVNSVTKAIMSRDESYVQESILLTRSLLIILNLGDKIDLYFTGCISNIQNEGVFNIFKVD